MITDMIMGTPMLTGILMLTVDTGTFIRL